MDSMSIRDAQIKDINTISKLIYSTENDPKGVWGGKNTKETLDNINLLINTQGSRYSIEYIKVAEKNNDVVGAIILIPYNHLERLNIKTDFIMLKKTKGIIDKFKLLISHVKF